LNPATRQARNTQQQPAMADGTKVNLFCSGHTFLADGRLLVVGGHFLDSQGLNQAVVYDPAHDTWTPSAVMNHGRWYPSAVTLPDGSALVVSGSFLQNGQTPNNVVPQRWSNGGWTTTAAFPDARTFDLFLEVRLFTV
jgi:hypothetical protein